MHSAGSRISKLTRPETGDLSIAPAFSKAEYSNRIDRVRHAMQTHDIEVLVIGDPSNMNWLTGFDSWSFYTPQLMVIDLVKGPFLMTRLMDVKAASFTT